MNQKTIVMSLYLEFSKDLKHLVSDFSEPNISLHHLKSIFGNDEAQNKDGSKVLEFAGFYTADLRYDMGISESSNLAAFIPVYRGTKYRDMYLLIDLSKIPQPNGRVMFIKKYCEDTGNHMSLRSICVSDDEKMLLYDILCEFGDPTKISELFAIDAMLDIDIQNIKDTECANRIMKLLEPMIEKKIKDVLIKSLKG